MKPTVDPPLSARLMVRNNNSASLRSGQATTYASLKECSTGKMVPWTFRSGAVENLPTQAFHLGEARRCSRRSSPHLHSFLAESTRGVEDGSRGGGKGNLETARIQVMSKCHV